MYSGHEVAVLVCTRYITTVHVVEFEGVKMSVHIAGILDVMFRLLDAYRSKQYVTPRVLQLILSYLAQS